MKKTKYTLIGFNIGLVLLSGSIAYGQFNNKPFQFKSSDDGGVGMSAAAKQAILQKEIYNITPDNLVRSPGKEYVVIDQGAGNFVLARRVGSTVFLTDFKGTSFRDNNPDMAAGVFNSYFSADGVNSYGPVYVSIQSGETITTWTTRVAYDGLGNGYIGLGEPIDVWTAQASSLTNN